jgi:MFS family permease
VKNRLFLSLHEPAFRWLWASSFFGFLNIMSSGLTIGWLVLELSNSPFWVGAAAGIMGLGQVGFGVFAGVLIDRLEQRRLLLVAQILNGLVPLVLGFLVLNEQIALWHILLGRFFQGTFTSVRAPTFNTIAYKMVGRQRMLNAAATLNLGLNGAQIVGSAVVGMLIAGWGSEGGLFFAAVAAFLGSICVFKIRGDYQSAVTRESFLQAAVDGLKYSWNNLSVRRLLSLSIIMETFGFSYHVMLPVIARDVLGVGATELGFLSSAGGVGATISTLFVASLGDFREKGRLLVYNALAGGFSLILFAFSPWYILSLFLVMLVSGSLMAYDTSMKTMFLLVTSDEVRGRVNSIYTLTYGFLSLGGLIAGSVATAVGAPVAIGISGFVILAFNLFNLQPLKQLQPADEVSPVIMD